MRKKRVELLKEVNEAIKVASLADLIIRDTYLNSNIIQISEEKRKNLILDNEYYFKLEKRIRYQPYKPIRKYF
jgi:C4-type Zn-finger protein